MRTSLAAVLLIATALPLAAQPSQMAISRQVADDARVLKRIADVARRDLPKDLVGRILEEDLELLRGPRGDRDYAYARWERTESGRKDETFGIRPGKDPEELSSVSVDSSMAYQMKLAVPGRRLLVRRNNHFWAERVEVSWTPVGSAAPRSTVFAIQGWMEPGDERTIDFPEIGKDVKVTLYGRADAEQGVANVDVTVLRPTLVDDAGSPFATVVRRVKTLQDASKEGDYRKVRNVSDEVLSLLGTAGAEVAVGVVPVTPGTSQTVYAPRDQDLYFELKHVQDLLTGNEDDRREGMRRLEEILSRLRPSL